VYGCGATVSPPPADSKSAAVSPPMLASWVIACLCSSSPGPWFLTGY
jgi:hypothetical protein